MEDDEYNLQRDAETSADTKKYTSMADTKIFNDDEEHGKELSHTVALKERTVKLDEGQLDQTLTKSCGSGYLKPMHEDFVATVYPKVHERLKLTTEEHDHIENLPSLSETLLSMKNLDDAFTLGDQFLNDKPPKKNQKRYVPTLRKNKLQGKTTQALSSRVYSFENHDLYTKIDKYINEVIKEAVHNALQALIRKHFRDLSKFEIKEIIHDRMFKSGSYRSHLKHTTLYEALDAYMDFENREEFNEEMAKSRKIHCDDQDPLPPPPKDSD
nr:hypothetical protein [Tanacetum cinerariifolium]